MKVYTIACVCDVCGEEGVARPSEASWFGGMVHRNPDVCRAVLERRRREVEKRERALGAQS